MGYLYAVKMGYEYIVDTDDDTYPTLTFDKWREDTTEWKTISGPKFPNVMSFFTDKKIWPRGYPINLLKQKEVPEYSTSTIFEKQSVGIVQSLAKKNSKLTKGKKITFLHFDAHTDCFEKLDHFWVQKNPTLVWPLWFTNHYSIIYTLCVANRVLLLPV